MEHERVDRQRRRGAAVRQRLTRLILATCREAMPDHARLVLIEAVMSQRAREQPGAVRMDLHMLTLLRGRERTAREYQALLAATRFELRRVVPALPAVGLCVLEASCASREALGDS